MNSWDSGAERRLESVADTMIDVVVIGRNEQRDIADCLSSVMKAIESFERSAVVYVDNNSTDSTVEIASTYPLRILRRTRPPFNSPFAAYIQGIRATTGTYVQVLEADCVLDGKWFEVAIDYMEANPQVGAVAGRVVEAEPNNGLLGQMYKKHCERISIPGSQPRLDGPGVLIRRRCLPLSKLENVSLRIGEGHELYFGTSIRKSGWSLFRLDAPMLIHKGPRKGFLGAPKSSLRNGFRYSLTIARLKRLYPEDNYLKGLFWRNLLPIVPILAALLILGFASWTLVLQMGVIASFLLIIMSTYRRKRPDLILMQSILLTAHTLGFSIGAIASLRFIPAIIGTTVAP